MPKRESEIRPWDGERRYRSGVDCPHCGGSGRLYNIKIGRYRAGRDPSFQCRFCNGSGLVSRPVEADHAA